MSVKKFKVWCKGTSKNANFDVPRWIDIDDFILNKYYSRIGFLLEDTDFVVCEYTGVNDYLNNPIYENDVVKATFGTWERVGQVTFKRGCYICEWTDGTTDVLGLMGVDRVDLLGNVFSNPELVRK